MMRQIRACLVWLALLPAVAIAQTASPRLEPLPPKTGEGQPIEQRQPEKDDHKPPFPEQTTAPYHARARLESDKHGDKLSDVKVIFRATPQWPAKGLGGKTGGRIVFGRDGNLFVTIGDRDTSPQTTIDWMAAQKLSSHLGKVIHITQ